MSADAVRAPSAAAAHRYYDVAYRAHFRPEAGVVDMESLLSGERLPSRSGCTSIRAVTRNSRRRDPAQIEPRSDLAAAGKGSRLSYEFVVNHERSPQRYDSLMTEDWALFRGDKLVPRASVTAAQAASIACDAGIRAAAGLVGRDALRHRTATALPGRRSRAPLRSAGGLDAGGQARQAQRDRSTGVQTSLSRRPTGDSARRQDMLAFLNWNLPHLKEVFPHVSETIVGRLRGRSDVARRIVGPGSLFLHSDRPLISENRTSTLLHELVHVAMGIRGDEESDWIVEARGVLLARDPAAFRRHRRAALRAGA